MTAAAEQSRLQRYLDEIAAFNERVKLTTVPPERWWQRHIDESVGLLSLMDPAPGSTRADVGSGAGVPGIPIAVMRPDIAVILIEADRQKAGFLVHVAGVIDAHNVTVLAARAETVGHDPGYRQGCDVVVSRATAALPALCELCLPLLRVGGRMAAVVSQNVAEDGSGAARACGGGIPHRVAPGIVVVDKISTTPARYPRRAGLPAKSPLR